MKSLIFCLALITLCIFLSFFITYKAFAKRYMLEDQYVQENCIGTIEHKLYDKTRIDCLTNIYAIEFDFANKWAECIGQSLWYAKVTGNIPQCYLIIEKPNDCKHIPRISSIVLTELIDYNAYCE